MKEPQQLPPNMFVDAFICGAIGGTVAYAVGEDFLAWTVLSLIVGPLFVLIASILVELLPDTLPGKRSGYYEFALFGLLVLLIVLNNPFPW